MIEKMIGWAPWHPKKGFEDHLMGPIAYADLDDDLVQEIKDLNEDDADDPKWKAVKVEITKI